MTYTNAMSCDHDIFLCHAGIVGLNNIKANDYMNIVLQVRWWFDWIIHLAVPSQTTLPCMQALNHVAPVRDFFLDEKSYGHIVPPPGDQNFVVGRHTQSVTVNGHDGHVTVTCHCSATVW